MDHTSVSAYEEVPVSSSKAVSHAIDRRGPDAISQVINFLFQSISSLTQEQRKLLDFLGDYKRVLIKGCAGSGKIMIIEDSVSNV
jgi:hypothetical protein